MARGILRRHQRPEEFENDIRAALRLRQPNLHLHLEDSGLVVRGMFAVWSPEGRTLDRYKISIELPADYPTSLPVVRELGGRIPHEPDYHVEPDGRACILLPDDRWRCFPPGAPFQRYLDGPLHDYFLGQSLVELGESWPFGEWRHGAYGIHDFYVELLETDVAAEIDRVLFLLGKREVKGHWDCPCNSGERIKRCCAGRLSDLRRKIPPRAAREARKRLGFTISPYKGPRARKLAYR